MKKIESIEAYPLQWPQGWKRTKRPKKSQFRSWIKSRQRSARETRDKTVSEGIDFITEQLRLLGVNTNTSVVISTNMPTRKDGLPFSNAREPDDSGVAVYFMKDGEQVCMPCDTYNKAADNLYAVGKVIEAMRAIERHGSDIMNAAFSGFKALPETGSGVKWWEVLEVDRSASMDEIKKAYRKLSKENHPDRNGSAEQFQVIQEALRQAKQSKKG